jgi:hypothetical protein
MRELTGEEAAVLARAEKRIRFAHHWRVRQSVIEGQVDLMTAMLGAIDAVPPRTRMRLEPALLGRKAALLKGGAGLSVLALAFEGSAEQLLASALNSP